MTSARHVTRLVSLAVILCWLAGCGATARQKTISATLTATDSARAGFVAFDAKHQDDLVGAAKDPDSGKAALVAWRADRAKLELVFEAAYRAIATAATVNDDPSFAGMLTAAAILSQELKALGVIK